MHRRTFIKSGLALAGGATEALSLQGCATPEPSSRLATRLNALARAVRGKVVVPEQSSYLLLGRSWNARFDGVAPLAIVMAADESDVAQAITFARDTGLPFVARSGGHSFAGYSTCPGIVIDVRALNTVRVDRSRARATVGAGMTNLPLYEALWPERMAVPAGTCPTVGITGLALGGGFGRLSPLHGLASDNLLGVRVVGADGKVVIADEQQNRDLLWACRGGGGGNFGVATELTFRLAPVDMPFTDIGFTFALPSALRVLRAWQSWITELPPQGHCDLHLVTDAPTPDGGAVVKVDFTYPGNPERAQKLARELIGTAASKPLHTITTTAPFVSSERNWTCAGLQPDECQYQGLTPNGKLPRTAMYIKSDLVFRPWPDEGLERLIAAVARRQADRRFTPQDFHAGAQVGKVYLESCGGAINHTAADATAFPHRNMLYVAQYQARWLPGSDTSLADANVAWVRAMYDSVAPWRSGASYVNYTDPDLTDWQRAYYAANLPRLKEIKRKYDPDNVFRFAQSIPPA
jgi:FAD/FMN-containing dehydrogenase